MTPLEIYNISPVTYCHEPGRDASVKKEMAILKREHTRQLNANKILIAKNLELLAHLNKPPEAIKVNTYSTAEKIKQITADFYNIEVSSLLHRIRTREVALARQVCMYLITKNTKLSLKTIGLLFNRDHTTVMYSRETIKDLMWSDPKIKRDVDYLQQAI